MIAIDIDYAGYKILDISKWLECNIGGCGVIKSHNSICSDNWKIYHTSKPVLTNCKDEVGSYIITRAEFNREEDAVLFRLAWV